MTRLTGCIVIAMAVPKGGKKRRMRIEGCLKILSHSGHGGLVVSSESYRTSCFLKVFHLLLKRLFQF